MATKRGTALQADEEAVVPLQAIVLADTFAQKFRPITLERSKVLLPLVNVPMIDYTLEWLATAGAEEVFVFCCAHSQQVTSHVEHYWKAHPGFRVTCIVALDCVSAGDALRLIDQKAVIRGDFVLVTGDTVSNMSLARPLKEHRERRKRDKQAVMTMVTQRSKAHPLTRQTRLGSDEHLYVINPETKQLLLYDYGREFGSRGLGGQRAASHQVALDKAFLEEHASVQLRTDLQDCHVDICSPEVLMLFTDNFDYQHIRRDFVKGLLNDDIMGNKIFTYEIAGEYAARVDNLRSYDVVSRDIIHRWPYPLLPDVGFGSHTNTVQVGRGNKYKEENVQLARTAYISENAYIGEGTIIGDNSVIRESVIGRNCLIGRNAVVEGSYLWSGVTVGDGAVVRHAVLCDGVVVKAGAGLEPGVVLAFQVVIGSGFQVPAYSQISLQPQPYEEDSGDEELEYSESGSIRPGLPRGDESSGSERMAESVGLAFSTSGGFQAWRAEEVGADGAGFKWTLADSGPHEEEWRHSVAPFPRQRLEELAARELEGEAGEASRDSGEGITGGEGQAGGDQDEEEDEEEDEDEDEFASEVQELFQRTVDEGATFDNIVLEINALKLGMVRTFADCAGAVFRGMLSVMVERARGGSAKELLAHAKEVLHTWGPLLRRFLKQQDDEVEVLLTFEEECSESRHVFAPHFATMLAFLYEYDIVSEEAIMAWAEEKKFAEETDKAFLKQSAKFIQWLQEADEEESEEEEEEEDEDEEDEEEEETSAPPPPPPKTASAVKSGQQSASSSSKAPAAVTGTPSQAKGKEQGVQEGGKVVADWVGVANATHQDGPETASKLEDRGPRGREERSGPEKGSGAATPEEELVKKSDGTGMAEARQEPVEGCTNQVESVQVDGNAEPSSREQAGEMQTGNEKRALEVAPPETAEDKEGKRGPIGDEDHLLDGLSREADGEGGGGGEGLSWGRGNSAGGSGRQSETSSPADLPPSLLPSSADFTVSYTVSPSHGTDEAEKGTAVVDSGEAKGSTSDHIRTD